MHYSHVHTFALLDLDYYILSLSLSVTLKHSTPSYNVFELEIMFSFLLYLYLGAEKCDRDRENACVRNEQSFTELLQAYTGKWNVSVIFLSFKSIIWRNFQTRWKWWKVLENAFANFPFTSKTVAYYMSNNCFNIIFIIISVMRVGRQKPILWLTWKSKSEIVQTLTPVKSEVTEICSFSSLIREMCVCKGKLSTALLLKLYTLVEWFPFVQMRTHVCEQTSAFLYVVYYYTYIFFLQLIGK